MQMELAVLYVLTSGKAIQRSVVWPCKMTCVRYDVFNKAETYSVQHTLPLAVANSSEKLEEKLWSAILRPRPVSYRTRLLLYCACVQSWRSFVLGVQRALR